MKVLAISSSLRIGGNSDILCDQFLKGANEVGHETKKINLARKKIGPCIGCAKCVESRKCVQKDDMTEIIEALMNADVIVLSTPIYFYSMTGQLKIFIDRCLPGNLEIQNKQFYYIITAAEEGKDVAESTIVGLRGYLRCLPGAKEKGIVYGMGVMEKGEILDMPAIQEAYEMGRKI